MSNLSDLIEKYIRGLLKNNEKSIIEIQRNLLASKFDCAPSQINYVLTTRFNVEKGYVVESRRGGGGFIRIYRIPSDNPSYLLKKLYYLVGDEISQQKALNILSRLEEEGIISLREAKIISTAVDRNVLKISLPERDQTRARIMQAVINILLVNY